MMTKMERGGEAGLLAHMLGGGPRVLQIYPSRIGVGSGVTEEWVDCCSEWAVARPCFDA